MKEISEKEKWIAHERVKANRVTENPLLWSGNSESRVCQD